MRLWGGFEGSVHIKHLEQYLAGICVKSINITIAITIVTTFGLCKPLLCLHGGKSFRKGQANLVGHYPCLYLQMMRSSGLSTQQGSSVRGWEQG